MKNYLKLRDRFNKWESRQINLYNQSQYNLNKSSRQGRSYRRSTHSDKDDLKKKQSKEVYESLKIDLRPVT